MFLWLWWNLGVIYNYTACLKEDLGELDLKLDRVDTLTCPYRNASFFAINNGLGCYMGDATIGSMATYSCNHGYSPVGSTDQRCLYNGNWSGTPKCNGTYYSFASRHEMHIIRVRLYRRVNFSHTLHAVISTPLLQKLRPPPPSPL